MPFIGRERELQRLYDLLLASAQGRGGTVFVEGRVGMGKESLLKRLQELAREAPELEGAELVSVRCDPNTDQQDAWEPFGEILRGFTEETERKSDRRRRVLEIVKEYGPDFARLIPVVGGLAAVGAKLGSDVLLSR